ncbi:hypothetical protein BH09ACT5_BH09ACT5_05030 [soil metagenome]
MANEPSWEDIFNPTPAGADLARQQAPTEPDAVEEDPLAALFGGQEPADLVEPTSPGAASAPPVPGPAAPAPAAPADSFSALFGVPSPEEPAPEAYPPTRAYPAVVEQPTSRREARESEGRRRADGVSRNGSGGSGSGGSGRGGSRATRKRSLRWLAITLPIVILLGAVGGVAAFGWFNYNEQVRELLGIPLPTDYEGTGNGEEVVVSIRSGDIGSDVAVTLHEAGVTMTYDAVYDYLVENPDVGFTPGNWRLQKQMSAESAVAALQDPENKVTDELLLREGISLASALELISETLGVPLEEVQAAAADPVSYGLPAQATTLEGFLFPAKYELDGTETPQQVLQKLVDTMFEHLDSAGVPVENRFDVVIMASIIQREAGQNTDDFYKISRVFQNRIEQGINLESDATVAYGTGRFDSVWTEPEEREDASNRYNTYANPGLPVGPIGLPGDQAIDAALHPADGPWLFFVPINLATGETVFSETVEEHEAAVEQLLEWCDASPENATYCE